MVTTNQEIQEKIDELKETSCKNCFHVPVCRVHLSVLKFFEETFPKVKDFAFDPDELGEICQYYNSPMNTYNVEGMEPEGVEP